MPARPRGQIVDKSVPGLYHCVSRCVRRAFLCGQDNYSGINYDHRKKWVEDRIEFLAGLMALDVTSHALMDNHLHVTLRTRPDLVRDWSNQEVARRWLKLCPGKRKRKDNPPPEQPTAKDIDQFLQDRKKLAEVRERLSSLSWFMKFLKESIARKANAEDETTGAFWEGRFKSTRLLDEFAILMCSIYVDLNPIRAGKTKTPESSPRTSAYHRIRARRAREPDGEKADLLAAAWLAPIYESAPAPDGGQVEHGRRASDNGFLPMPLEKYLLLLDWSGRTLREGKRGAIPSDAAPILDRLGLEVDYWLRGLQEVGEWFSDFAGQPTTLRQFAAEKGLGWLKGMA